MKVRIGLVLATLMVLAEACASAPNAANARAVWPEKLDHASTADTHREAAQELLTVMPLQETMDAAVNGMLEQQLSAQPALRVVEPEMRAFFSKYLNADALKSELAELYVQHFSELELRQAQAFYRTPTGQHMLSETPRLYQEAATIGMRRMQEHQAELQDAVQKKLGSMPPPPAETERPPAENQPPS